MLSLYRLLFLDLYLSSLKNDDFFFDWDMCQLVWCLSFFSDFLSWLCTRLSSKNMEKKLMILACVWRQTNFDIPFWSFHLEFTFLVKSIWNENSCEIIEGKVQRKSKNGRTHEILNKWHNFSWMSNKPLYIRIRTL